MRPHNILLSHVSVNSSSSHVRKPGNGQPPNGGLSQGRVGVKRPHPAHFREALPAPQIHSPGCLLHSLNHLKGSCQVSVNGVDPSKSHPLFPVVSDASAGENAVKVYLSP